MRQTVIAAMVAAMMAAYGVTPRLCAEPLPVVHVPDDSLDAAMGEFRGGARNCACEIGGSKKGQSNGSCNGSCGSHWGAGFEDLCAPWTLLPELAGGVSVTGWLEVGAAAADRTVGRSLSPLAFNDRQETTVNQLYSVIERSIDTTRDWDIGGRIDILFGTDARFTEVPGLELERDGSSSKWNSHTYYRLSMPQAYAEIGAGNWSVKVGHW